MGVETDVCVTGNRVGVGTHDGVWKDSCDGLMGEWEAFMG